MRLAVIPGDGIGPEVIDEALKVLDEVVPGTETTNYDLGAARWHSTGELLPETVLTELQQHDAILLGAVGDPSVPERHPRARPAAAAAVRARPPRQPAARPALPGRAGPARGQPRIDMVVVREGTEGPYVGTGGLLRKDTPHEIATEVSTNTAYGVERVVRDAFARAERRPRKHLTLVHKTNVLTFSGRLWSRIVEEVSLEHPDVSVAYQHIDATTIHMVRTRGRFDVIVTDNLFGDIITDLAGGVTGGMGLAASGNLDVSRRNPSMFEPVHGSAPDIAGQGIADPTAAVLSVALLLDHLGERDSARRIEAAVAFDLATRDHSATGHTRSIGDRLAAPGQQPRVEHRRAGWRFDAAAYDALTVEELRARGGLKWTRYGPGSLGAFVAEMDTGTAPAVRAALHAAVEAGEFGYLPPGPAAAMAEACAAWQRDRYGWTVAPDDVRPVADVLRGLEIVIGHLTAPGRPVILPTPAYMPFLELPGLLGREILDVPATRVDGRPALDLDGIDAAFRAGGELLVLTNPHNPLGRVFTARRAARGVRGRRPARRPRLRRRDPRAAGLPRPRARAVRHGLPDGGPARRHRNLGVQGVEPAGSGVRAADPLQRRRPGGVRLPADGGDARDFAARA